MQRMDLLFTFFLFVIVAAAVGRFLYGRIKHGSWTGSYLNAQIDRTVGELTLGSGFAARRTLAVHSMRAAGGEDDFVALVYESKAPPGFSMQPYKLTKGQARELANYLTQAST